MLIIVGLDGVLRAIAAQNSGNEIWQEVARQMGHAAWEGLRVYDMVFPLFVFIAGIAMGISQQKQRQKEHKAWQIASKLWLRAGILVVLGWVVNGALSWDSGSMRYASVLGLIGISCAIAGSIGLVIRHAAARAGIAAGVAAAIWMMHHTMGDMSPSGCLNARIDQLYLPGVLHYEVLDPEGLLCQVSAVVLALSGMVCSSMLNIHRTAPRIAAMLGTGILLMYVGTTCCGPIIKNIWSCAFVVSTAGWGFLLMGAMHLIIDVWGLRRWAFPLRVVGMNPLFIYLCTHILPFDSLTARLFGGTIRCIVPEAWYGVAHHTAYLLLAWTLCYYLYRRRIFLKI